MYPLFNKTFASKELSHPYPNLSLLIEVFNKINLKFFLILDFISKLNFNCYLNGKLFITIEWKLQHRDFEKASDDTKYVLGRILEGLMQLSESKCEFQKKKPSPYIDNYKIDTSPHNPEIDKLYTQLVSKVPSSSKDKKEQLGSIQQG